MSIDDLFKRPTSKQWLRSHLDDPEIGEAVKDWLLGAQVREDMSLPPSLHPLNAKGKYFKSMRKRWLHDMCMLEWERNRYEWEHLGYITMPDKRGRKVGTWDDLGVIQKRFNMEMAKTLRFTREGKETQEDNARVLERKQAEMRENPKPLHPQAAPMSLDEAAIIDAKRERYLPKRPGDYLPILDETGVTEATGVREEYIESDPDSTSGT